MTSSSVKTLGFKAGERNVFFHLLTACNLSCVHCYIDPMQHGTNMVSRQEMLDWLKLFAEPDKKSNIIFLGGEPTMHPDLALGIKTARELGYQSITVDSNGFLFHDLLDKIAPEEAVISFSLDGPAPEINDPIRGLDVFRVCTENLQKTITKGFDVSVIYTVSRMNIDHLDKMPELLGSFGVKRFFIQVIGFRGRSAGARDKLQITPDEWLAKIPLVAARAADMGIKVIYPKVFLDKDEVFQCAGQVAENYFIFPNGRVYQCPLCEDYPVNSLRIENNKLIKNKGLTEDRFFTLDIAEGCVMNKLLQPGNIVYDEEGRPRHRISCCLLKQEVS
jgi:MoaA/NifB/PqqE/SkfB family radical SAM enzyme